MYCSKCGAELTADSKFCNRCGSAVTSSALEETAEANESIQSIAGSSQTLPPAPKKNSHLACPVCNRDDRVVKISSIVSGQTHEISGGGYTTQTYVDGKGKTQYESHYAPMSGTQQSVLAGQLSPPPKPDAGLNPCGPISLVLSIMFGLSLIGIGGLIFGNPIIGFIVIAIGILVYVSTDASRQEKVNKVEQEEVPKWEKAIQRWNHLYYCHRDDILFVPEEGIALTKSQMYEYLYQ